MSRKSAPWKEKTVFGGDAGISVWKHILKETSNSFLRFYQPFCRSQFCSFALLQIPVGDTTLGQPKPPAFQELEHSSTSSRRWWGLKAVWSWSAACAPRSETQIPPLKMTATSGNYLWLKGRTAHVIWELVAFSRLFLVKKGIMQIYIMSSSLYTYVDSTFRERQNLWSWKLHWHFSC